MDAKAARIEASNVVYPSRWLGANRRDLRPRLTRLRDDAPQVVDQRNIITTMDAKAARIEASNVATSSRWLGANRRDLRPRLTRL